MNEVATNTVTQRDASVDVSIVVNLHNESLLLHRTLTSVTRAVAYAQTHGCRIEVVLVGDRLTAATKDFLSRTELTKGMSSLHEVDFGDLAESRNRGASLSKGTFVLFCDGDDLLSPQWPYRAWVAASKTSAADAVAFHPECIVNFDAESFVVNYVSSTDARFDLNGLAGQCGWGAVLMARRRLLVDVPFTSASSGGFGFEDWHWLNQLLASGGRVECVPQTVGFIRRKWEGSLLAKQNSSHCLLRPTDLLRPSRLASAPDRRDRRDVREQRSTLARSRTLRQSLEREGRQMVLRHPALVPYAYSARALMRRVENRLLSGLGQVLELDDGIPDWLPSVCREMHEVDYAIFPDDSLLRAQGPWFAGRRTEFGDAYAALCRVADRDVTHVLVVPWVKRGGADAEAINYAAALDSLGYGETTVVLATEDSPSPWSSRLPRSVCFVELGSITRMLTFDEAQRLLATYLVQAGPDVVHIMNSRLGYAAVQRYGEALASISRLYACVFCEDLTVEGRTVGYAFAEVPRVAERLTAIMADNASILARLTRQYGIPADMTFVHRHPVPTPAAPEGRDRPGHRGVQVLWAGRLDRQKRPDLLVAIAQRCQHLDLEFHAFGAPVLASPKEFAPSSQGNVTFHGHYEDPGSLRWADYDIFLNTSEWDGLPNVILEAMAAGLPIVTSDVGGIVEALGPSQAGLLVSPFDDVNGYVDALGRLAADPVERESIGHRGRNYVTRFHSRQQFVAAVAAVPGYAPSPSGTEPHVSRNGSENDPAVSATSSDHPGL